VLCLPKNARHKYRNIKLYFTFLVNDSKYRSSVHYHYSLWKHSTFPAPRLERPWPFPCDHGDIQSNPRVPCSKSYRPCAFRVCSIGTTRECEKRECLHASWVTRDCDNEV
jgi:hypothetical protein